jgi:O-antigen/teichoic acid export membrane protein
MARAVAWNAIARWASQILSWASTILVARLLTPYDYGIMGMAGLYLSLAMLISQAGIGQAIVALRDVSRRQIAELNTVSVFLGVSLVGLSCIVAHPLAHFFSAPQLFAVVAVSSTTCLINGFQVVPRGLLQKELRFKLLAIIETVRAFLQIIVTVLLAWLRFGYWSLVLGSLLGCLTACAMTVYWNRIEFAFPHVQGLRRELKFGGQVILSGVAWYAYDNADFGVAGRVLGEVALGNYTVAWTISSAPVEKITNLVTTVTPTFFSAMQTDKAELRRYLLRLSEVISYLTVPAGMGLALVADHLVPVLLGPKWYGAIGPLRLLAVLFAVRSLCTILPNLLTAIGDAAFVMRTTVVSAIIMPLAFLVGSRWGTNGIAATWVIAYPVIMAPMFFRVLGKTDALLREYLSALRPALHGSAVMIGVVMLTRWAFPARPHSPLSLSILILAGALSYSGVFVVFYRDRVRRLIDATRLIFLKEQKDEDLSTTSVSLVEKE